MNGKWLENGVSNKIWREREREKKSQRCYLIIVMLCVKQMLRSFIFPFAYEIRILFKISIHFDDFSAKTEAHVMVECIVFRVFPSKYVFHQYFDLNETNYIGKQIWSKIKKEVLPHNKMVKIQSEICKNNVKSSENIWLRIYVVYICFQRLLTKQKSF